MEQNSLEQEWKNYLALLNNVEIFYQQAKSIFNDRTFLEEGKITIYYLQNNLKAWKIHQKAMDLHIEALDQWYSVIEKICGNVCLEWGFDEEAKHNKCILSNGLVFYRQGKQK